MYPVKNCESQQAQAYNEYRHMIVPATHIPGPPHQPRDLFHPQQRAAGR